MYLRLLLLFLLIGCNTGNPLPEEADERPYFQVCALSQPSDYTCHYLQEAINTANTENNQTLSTDLSRCTVFQMYCGFVRTW